MWFAHSSGGGSGDSQISEKQLESIREMKKKIIMKRRTSGINIVNLHGKNHSADDQNAKVEKTHIKRASEMH